MPTGSLRAYLLWVRGATTHEMEAKLPVIFEMTAFVVKNNSNSNSFILLNVCRYFGASVVSHICATLVTKSAQMSFRIPRVPSASREPLEKRAALPPTSPLVETIGG